MQQVAKNDLEFVKSVSVVRQVQLEKMLLFERMSRIAEELEYTEMTPARRKHLLDQAGFIKKGFASKAEQSAKDVMRLNRFVDNGLQRDESNLHGEEFTDIKNSLKEFEQLQIRYDELMSGIFALINSENYQLNLNDLNQLRSQQRRITQRLDALLKSVEGFTQRSMFRVSQSQLKARQNLITVSLLAVAGSFILLIFLVKNISRPLKQIEVAAHQIAAGDYKVNLSHSSKDEVGEVAKAFNVMSTRLLEARNLLENKNQELEENLFLTRKQKQDLEKVNKELDDFVHTVSHDLRSPLMGIMNYGAVLNSRYKDQLDESARKCIQGVCLGVERLSDMIDDLLALTRIARVQNPYERVDIKDVIKTALDRLDYRIERAGAEIKCPENFPEIICDKIKITEAFLNLIGNAIKFSSHGNIEHPVIEIGFYEKGDMVEFFVKDNGIGIDVRDHEKVFEIFQRVDTEGLYEGTGAGLAIVKTIINDHGGKIWIDSTAGNGAAVRFVLPRNPGSSDV